MGIRPLALRGVDLADAVNAAATRGQVTFVTSRSRRVAAVVSVATAETAVIAVNLAMLLDPGEAPRA